jgi:hypothetical protein
MNLNDILAQQQANLNKAAQTSQRLFLWTALVEFAVFALFCWVVYMFYARLRDIGEELRRLRIAHEIGGGIIARSGSRTTGITPPLPPKEAERSDAKYMPKK